jgi:hypothetical protein
MIATKSEMKEIRDNPHMMHFVLLYKDAILSTNNMTPLPSVVSNVLQAFDDVFPKEIPDGLPPLRGIEHQIDLILGASLLNRPPYRTNPEETKEIQPQVQELLEKGYVRESLSPCAVPVILVPKKDGVKPRIFVENTNPCTFMIVPGSMARVQNISQINPQSHTSHHMRVKVHNLLHVHYGIHHYKPLG